MNEDVTSEELSSVLGKLQRVYRFRLDPMLLPAGFRTRFYEASRRFCKEEINEKKMGIAEEVGDLSYQVLKMLSVKWKLLTPENQRIISDRYSDKIGTAQFSFKKAYEDAHKEVNNDSLLFFYQMLPEHVFPDKKVIKTFFAVQYVSYMSRLRIYSQNREWAYQTEDFIKTAKIPEETAELVNILNTYHEKKQGKGVLQEVQNNIKMSEKLVKTVKDAVSDNAPTNNIFACLDYILKKKLGSNVNLGEALDFCLFKVMGRQELTFNGYSLREVMHICKPAEYLIEADLFS